VLYVYRANKKIILYLDNVRFHHAKLLKNFLSVHPKLEIRYLPSYSPDFNPVERVWWYMRKSITHNRYLETLNERKIKFKKSIIMVLLSYLIFFYYLFWVQI
jgi:transposase